MNGFVDDRGRALISILVRAQTGGEATDVEVWVDTGFTGELVLAQSQIAALRLPQSAVVTAELADGTSTTLDMHSCLIEWFGRLRPIKAIATSGESSLLGVALLDGRTLTIDYGTRTLTIE